MQQFLPYVWLAACLCSLLVPSMVLAQTRLTDGEKQAILDFHNQLRRQVDPPARNMEKMVTQRKHVSIASYHFKLPMVCAGVE